MEIPKTSHGQITLYLKGPDKTTVDITFDLQAINIIAEDGTPFEIMGTTKKINSVAITGQQILLSEKTLPIGKYKKLQFIVKEAEIARKEKTANLGLPPEGIYRDIDISISRNQNTSLFIEWNPDASITEGYLFNPAFTVKGQIPELGSLLIYVTNEDSNNVSVINRQSMDVVANIMVGNKPRGIATGLNRKNPKVYVANSGSNTISVIDPTTNMVEGEVPIRYGTQPEGIAVASISPERELIFVANYGSNTVSVIDNLEYREIQKINVGDGPIAVAVDPPFDSFSGSRFLSFENINILRNYRENYFNVYVVNKNSKNVSIITMENSGNSVKDVVNVGVDWSPMAITVDYLRAKAYIANYDYDNISVIDIVQIAQRNIVGSVSSIDNVGTSVIGVIADPDLDRLYLLKDVPGQIVIIRPFSETLNAIRTNVAMSPVVGTIPVGASPRSFIMDPEARTIYVVNRGSDTVSVIDKTTRQEIRTISVGKKPYGVAMFPF
jgi:YVTN family beta-propeller protein